MALKQQQFYTSMATAINAGLDLDRSLIASAAGSGRVAHAARNAVHAVQDGQTVADALAPYPAAFPAADLALIEIGEETGTLEQAFNDLADWHAFKKRIWRTIISGMIYPTVVIHIAALVIPAPTALLGKTSLAQYLLTAGAILACFYLPVGGALFVYRWLGRQQQGRRPFDEAVLRIPGVAGALRDLALSRYCRSFLSMYRAGAKTDRCNEQAVKMCGNTAVAAWFDRGTELARAGDEVSSGFSSRLPDDFISLWHSGEEGGRLEDSLERLTRNYADSAELRFQELARWVPRGVYAVIAVFLVYSIFKIATEVFSHYPVP